ncbi:MAG: VTC domain-containing protein [Coriobacteriales bacterium]|jgi:hypothetical protein
MGSYIGVFKRKEVKYRMSNGQLDSFMNGIGEHTVHDEFGLTRIYSHYFDTNVHEIISRSMDKPLYKEKLRLRTYGEPKDEDRVFVELKKKFKGVVYKRRVGMSYAAALEFLDGMPYEIACQRFPLQDRYMQVDSLSYKSIQISKEIDAFIDRNSPLHDAMLIKCDREAFVGIPEDDTDGIDRQLRITFDKNISYMELVPTRGGLHAREPSNGRILPSEPLDSPTLLLPRGEAIVEIKAMGSYPIWLADLLEECKAYPSSFSKYGESYSRCYGSLNQHDLSTSQIQTSDNSQNAFRRNTTCQTISSPQY